MARYVLALDQGTTSSRAILFDHKAQPVAMAQRELPQVFPQPGWVEHDPEEIWITQASVAEETLLRAGAGAKEVAAIGIANQRETTLLWDRKTGRPIANAIVWQDRRTAEHCEALRAGGHQGLLRSRTGLVADAYFSATKLAWMLETVPGARERAEAGELAFGTVDSFLVWRLTGGKAHVTDVTNASRTLLYDLNEHRWHPDLLSLFGIPDSVLPRVVPSSGSVGETAPGLFGGAIPIAGMAGDQQAATFGQACFQPGSFKCTYGTGCFLLGNVGSQVPVPPNGLLATVGWALDGELVTYAVEGSVFVAGAAVQWLRDGLGILASSEESEGLARSVPDTAGVTFVPAFVGLGAPHWDPHARGLISGITRGVTKAHLARAALESIALQTEDVLAAIRSSGLGVEELRVDGGASKNDFLMQFQADISSLPVARPKITETTALGAAFLAGLAVGFWSDPAELAALWQLDRRFEPGLSESERTRRLEDWQEAVQRARSST